MKTALAAAIFALSAALSAPVMAHLRSVWQYRGLIGNFAQRELKSKYKGSLFGWLWSLLNPAATLLIYTLVFSFFLRIPPPVAGNGHTKTFISGPPRQRPFHP